MALKVVKRTTVIKNIIAFVVLSLVFLHIVLSISKGVSAKSFEMLMSNINAYKPLMALALVTVFSLINAKRVSRLFLSIFCISVVSITFIIFLESYDKFILIYNFIYLLSSYYFYSLFTLEMKEAFYEPGYKLSEIGNRKPYEFKVFIEDKSQTKFEGYISNWNNSSCFIGLNKKGPIINGEVKVIFEYANRKFEQSGQVVTRYENGYGVKFLEVENSTKHNWESFYAIIHDRGYSI